MVNVSVIRSQNLSAASGGDHRYLIDSIPVISKMIEDRSEVKNCLAHGYAPCGYTLADFSIIRAGDAWHLFHIPRVDGGEAVCIGHEHWFGHATSKDLDTWITQNPVLCTDTHNDFESAHLWAPFVMEHQGRYLMYYTGLDKELGQTLCVAESDDPNLERWQKSSNNPIVDVCGFDWQWKTSQNRPRHMRDPHIVRIDDHYLLAYTTMRNDGYPCVGGLISYDLQKWEDIGPILYQRVPPAAWHPESVNIQQLPDGRWVMMPSQCPGIHCFISDDPYSWHYSKGVAVEYRNGTQSQPTGIEILLRNDSGQLWLVAFFEVGNNRMFLGSLNIAGRQWCLQRITNNGELEKWLR
jgi:predicted GH43/DUF377 family glycosyl hydrolase